MDRKENNEPSSSVNALQSRENAALMNEVHDMEDRIDIASMEIEDLGDYCAMVAGEIQFLRARLEKSPDFKDASDRKTELRPENSLETKEDMSGPAGLSFDEKHPDVLSGDSFDDIPEYKPESSPLRDGTVWEAATGGNVLDPFAPSEEEDKRKPKAEKGKRKKKQKEDIFDQESAQPEKSAIPEPETVPVTPAYKRMMMEPGEEMMETGVVPAAGYTAPDLEESAEAAEEQLSENEPGAEEQENKASAPAVKTEPDNVPDKDAEPVSTPKKRRLNIPGLSGRSRRKRNADRIYCPNCGSFVGEEKKCPWCGTRVK